MHYILVNKKPVECDLHTWATWFESNNIHVRSTKFLGIHVSTVFLGLDHQFGEGDPLLFETMIFGGKADYEYQERYTTWDQAVKGHRKAVLYALDSYLHLNKIYKIWTQFKSWIKP